MNNFQIADILFAYFVRIHNEIHYRFGEELQWFYNGGWWKRRTKDEDSLHNDEEVLW